MNFVADGATICALATPPGVGAIAVIRVSGPDAIPICQRMSRRKLENLEANRVAFTRLHAPGNEEDEIDEVVLTFFRAPRSFTGEDVIEIGCHGSPYIQQRLLEALISAGCRYAKQGEFTFRAFFNGKMDLSQAEAVADLIAAENEAAHHLALHQLRGGFSKEIGALRQRLIDFASLIELELDFAEEDVEFADRSQFLALLREIDALLSRLIDSFRTGNALKNGIPVAIIGKPNAGKSTLLNLLLNEERAIVSDIAGTTRDTIEDQISIEGVGFRFIDTAGLRETDDVVEKIGVERSMKAIRSAAIVLYLYDLASESEEEVAAHLHELKVHTDPDHQQVIVVGNKADLRIRPAGRNPQHLYLSAKTGEGLEELKAQLLERHSLSALGKSQSVVTNARHFEALSGARSALRSVVQGMENGLSGDFLSIDIRQALYHLGEITGEITSDDLLGNIFGKFCIGK